MKLLTAEEWMILHNLLLKTGLACIPSLKFCRTISFAFIGKCKCACVTVSSTCSDGQKAAPATKSCFGGPPLTCVT